MNGAREPSFVVSVGEFAGRLRELFRRIRAFEYIGISGEISEWTVRSNGVYFTLKDANAVLQCFAYANVAQRFPVVALGTAVIAYGAVRVHERRSRYELLVDALQLTGIGELFARYEALKEQFRLEGLFAPERKRAIPAFPRRIVLISAKGKGAEDFATVMRERAPFVRVEFIESRVQGIGAEIEIADALDRAARSQPDAIVLARGGGSYEDLFAFNLEPVVRAIVRANVPVITGIGHTGDHHLADDVADLACETPSNAAQFLANRWQGGRERLARVRAQLDREMRDIVARALQRADVAEAALIRAWERGGGMRRERLVATERQLLLRSPARAVAVRLEQVAVARTRLDGWPARALPRWHARFDASVLRLRPALERWFERRHQALSRVTAALGACDPAAPLARGYAMILRDDRVVRDAAQVAPGERIEARLGHGTFTARVETVTHDE